jgi:hypothetical protein
MAKAIGIPTYVRDDGGVHGVLYRKGAMALYLLM